MAGGRAVVAGVVAIVVTAASFPRAIGAEAPATLTVAQSAAVRALDPAGPEIFPVSPAGDEAAFLVYDGLVRFSEGMGIAPALATSWSVASDGRTWTFKLREGVSFQDGTPLTAQAVAQDLQREVDPQTNPSNRSLWDPIGSVAARGAATVQIVTREPYGALLNTLAHGSALIASPRAVEHWGGQYGLHPVGTGPYQVSRWDVGAQVEMVRTSRYWDGRPGFDRILLRNVPDPTTRVAMIQSGQAQIAEGIPPENVDALRREPGTTVIVKPALRTIGMGINLTRPVLQNIRVRQALNYAVDKDLIVKALFQGEATVLHSPLAPGAAEYVDLGPWPYDASKARVLLEEAGWKPAPPIGVRVKDGTPLELTLLTPRGAFPRDVEVTETLADYLRNVGVEVHFQYVEPSAFWGHLLIPPQQYTWDLVLFGFTPANGDGGSHLDSLFRSNPDRQHRPPLWNVTWYSRPEVDAWLAEGSRTIAPRARAAIYARVERQVWEDVPYLWLYAENVIVAVRRVSGVEVLPTAVTILRSAHP